MGNETLSRPNDIFLGNEKIGVKREVCSFLFVQAALFTHTRSHTGEQYYRAIVLIDEKEVLQSRSCCVCGLGSSFAFVSELTIATIRIDDAVFARMICSSLLNEMFLLFSPPSRTDLRSSRLRSSHHRSLSSNVDI